MSVHKTKHVKVFFFHPPLRKFSFVILIARLMTWDTSASEVIGFESYRVLCQMENFALIWVRYHRELLICEHSCENSHKTRYQKRTEIYDDENWMRLALKRSEKLRAMEIFARRLGFSRISLWKVWRSFCGRTGKRWVMTTWAFN